MAAACESASFSLKSMPASFASVEYGKLEKIRHLGSGGFGMVYLCRHRQWGKVAVKQVIYKKVTEQMKKGIQREIQKMWQVICSPHIVSLMGMTEVPNDGIYIIMEYLKYGSLKNFAPSYMVNKDPLNPDRWMSCCWARRMHMICDIIRGMNFIHTSEPSITHRDLKLENIFVGNGYTAKIGDFGLSVSSLSRSACNQMGRQIGTITHIPPEVLSGQMIKATEAFDIYSFGITLFEFVALTEDNRKEVPYPVWANDSLLELWVKNSQRPNDELILQDTPEIVVTTMKACWDKDYTKRPKFQDIKDELTKYFEEKYETSLESADMAILQNIALKRNARQNSDDSDVYSIHDGSATSPSKIKSKQPIQPTDSPSEQVIIPTERADELSRVPTGEDRVDSLTEAPQDMEATSEEGELSAISPLKSNVFCAKSSHNGNDFHKENLVVGLQPGSSGGQSIPEGKTDRVTQSSQQPLSTRSEVESRRQLQSTDRKSQQSGANALTSQHPQSYDDAGCNTEQGQCDSIEDLNRRFEEKLNVDLPKLTAFGVDKPNASGVVNPTAIRVVKPSIFAAFTPSAFGAVNRTEFATEAVTSVPIQEEPHPQPQGNQFLTSGAASPAYQHPVQSPRLHPPRPSPTHSPRSSPGSSPRLSKKPTKDAVITEKHVDRIYKQVGKKYIQLGRELGLTTNEIDSLYLQHKDISIEEVVYRIMLKWIGRRGSKATRSVLVKALNKAELAHLCSKI